MWEESEDQEHRRCEQNGKFTQKTHHDADFVHTQPLTITCTIISTKNVYDWSPEESAFLVPGVC